MRVRTAPLLVLVLAAALASPAAAYVIYLKGGQQLTAREKPVISGKFLVFYTPLGAMQRIPATEYDEKRTLEMNEKGTGDAYVLQNVPEEKRPDGSGRKPSLSEYIQEHKTSGIGEERKPVEVAKEPKGGRTGSGEPSISASVDAQLDTTFLHTMETYGIKAPRITAAPPGIRVQGVTDAEEQVFNALKGIAKAIADSKSTAHPVTKAEIYLTTSTGENAGHFEMTADDADILVGGKKSPKDWFMANAIF